MAVHCPAHIWNIWPILAMLHMAQHAKRQNRSHVKKMPWTSWMLVGIGYSYQKTYIKTRTRTELGPSLA